MELSSSKNFRKRKPRKTFLIFQETKTLKKLLIFWEMELFDLPRENFLYFRKRRLSKISYIFSKESFSYTSRNENPEKNSLYFRKWNFFIF